ncbi:MAG: DUF1292 domain-containing protein [Firmicutes bacterium]|nr:DUF1292 domain-containing protein [Bacillota bacterium]
MEEFIKMTDENGNEYEFEFLDYVRYEGEHYALMLMHGEDSGDTYIFKVTEKDGEEEYEYIDDAVADAVFDKFRAESGDFYEFEG